MGDVVQALPHELPEMAEPVIVEADEALLDLVRRASGLLGAFAPCGFEGDIALSPAPPRKPRAARLSVQPMTPPATVTLPPAPRRARTLPFFAAALAIT